MFKKNSYRIVDVHEANTEETIVVFGVDCESRDTFNNGLVRYTITYMNVSDYFSLKKLWREFLKYFEWSLGLLGCQRLM